MYLTCETIGVPTYGPFNAQVLLSGVLHEQEGDTWPIARSLRRKVAKKKKRQTNNKFVWDNLKVNSYPSITIIISRAGKNIFVSLQTTIKKKFIYHI
jgi:hypothetical protein